MANIERVTFTLPSKLATIVKDAVESGEYASSSEVIREALRDWISKHDADQRALAELREMINEGMEGEGRPAADVFADLMASLKNKRAA
ncbi:MAG: type II toxin-antitoxin system ParD family antitoxin [Sphingorhabdus sp.]